VRAEPLVGGARERVAAERLYVEAPVRRGVHGVDVHARAGGVGGGDDAGKVRHRADRVGGGGDRDPPRSVAEDGLDRARGQLEGVGLGVGEAHGRAGPLGRDQPRADVGVVVEPRAHDLVAGLQRAAGGGREAHGHRGHARAEGDAARIAAQQRADARAGARHQLVGVVRGREEAAVVGVVAGAHELGHGLDRAVDHLGAGRAVEPRPAVAQPREAVAVHPLTSRSSCLSRS
jgi:hypothetical protein